MVIRKRTGNVGIGTTAPTETLSVNGNVSILTIVPRFSCKTIEGTNCRDSGGPATCNNFVDIAELFPASEPVDSGNIVVADYEKAIVGIVSTQPAIVIEGGRIVAMGSFTPQNSTLKPAIALAGRVPVKVTDENGIVKAGDLITTSSRAGFGMKCADELKCLNSVVGIALEDKRDGEAQVLVLVK